MTRAGVRVDGRPAIHEGVKEGERAAEVKALGADLEHQEGRVPGGLDVEGDKLRRLERRLPADLGCVNCDFLPWNEGGRATRLAIEGLRARQRASAGARRAAQRSTRSRARRTSANAE